MVSSKGMDAAIPGDVDEAGELSRNAHADPAETEVIDLLPPVVVEQPMLETLGMQRIEFLVGECPAPFEMRGVALRRMRRGCGHRSFSLPVVVQVKPLGRSKPLLDRSEER